MRADWAIGKNEILVRNCTHSVFTSRLHNTYTYVILFSLLFKSIEIEWFLNWLYYCHHHHPAILLPTQPMLPGINSAIFSCKHFHSIDVRVLYIYFRLTCHWKYDRFDDVLDKTCDWSTSILLLCCMCLVEWTWISKGEWRKKTRHRNTIQAG